jgi:hypothetical protein
MHLPWCAAGAALAVLALAPAADAATVSMNGSTAVFSAAPGEVNDLNVQINSDGSFQYYDVNNAVTPTPPLACEASSGGHAVDCPPGATAFDLELGDGNDKANVSNSGASFPVTLAGGDGDDELRSRGPSDIFQGGAGNDWMYGSGAYDLYAGGPGDDLIFNDDSWPGVVDCSGGGLDRAISGNARLMNCPAAPALKVTIAKRQTVRSFVRRGLRFSVACNRPCALEWKIQADRKTQRLMHRISQFLVGKRLLHDRDGLPKVGDAGSTAITAVIRGSATRKSLARAPRIGGTLIVDATDGLAGAKQVKLKFSVRR